MKIRNNIIYVFFAAFGMLAAACNGKLPVNPEGEANGSIVLGAGIGSSVAVTKVLADPDEGHGHHQLFTEGTKASVRMFGQWAGKGDVIEYTTATMGAESAANSKHNLAPCNPVLFWDDFGSADASNTGGRARGLDIVAVAVDGEATAPVVGNDQWNTFPWALAVNQSEGWAAKDLLVSNNVLYNAEDAKDNAYKFENRLAGKLLVFTHAMSKVTIQLTAGEGFPVGDVSHEHEFQSVPQVSLLNFKYTGNVNIVGKVATPTSEVANLTPAMYEGGAEHTAYYNALVYPGNAFADNTNIIRIAVDGNVYYINATKINAVNLADGDVFEKGINYIIKATLNKTNINVTATISDWVDLESEDVAPVINVNADWGKADTGTLGDGFTSFSFYRSLRLASGYSENLEKENDCIPAEAIAVQPTAPETKWSFKNSSAAIVKLFWPTHDTHYQFRGVWPLTETTAVGATPTAPHLETVNAEEAIKIYNTAYSAGTYPSDLLIGRPEFADESETCHNADHNPVNLYNGGICATQGLVTLNFCYMMSQVEVLLSTTDEGSTDHVQLGENTVVEIVNVTNSEYAKIGDRTITTGTQASEYTLDPVSTAGLEGDKLAKAILTRHSAIVPQPLTYTTAGAETNLRFKITVTNADAVLYADATEYNAANSTSLTDDQFNDLSDEEKIKTPADVDIYYADVNPIKKKNSAEKIAPNGRWERGVHYLYNLKITKTEITVTATLTDWIKVEGEEDVWF